MSALNLDTYSLSLITAKEDILSARSSTDWAVFTYEKKWSLKLLDSGVGGLEELSKKFNENLIQYGLCRVSDASSGGPRIILIYWVGQNVDAFRRGVAAEHLPSIRRFFKEANVVLGAQKVDDINQEVVAQALSRVPAPARTFQKPRIPGSNEVVGTKYMKTNPAVEMKISKREAFWQRSEREEERRKEAERLRLQEERINLERERIQRERQEEEDRDRRIQEKERMVEEQRKEQARIDAERRRMEKERWAQQQKEFEEEMKGRFRRSQSIEMAAEAAALVSGRSLHPRDFFRQQERSVSSSFSPPSTPSSPSKSSSGFFNRTTLRYQRSVTESILTPPSRSPTFFQGFQKRDSFSSLSPNNPQPCSPAFIFSKSPLPGTSPKVDSLPSFIPPPITATRVTPTQVRGSSPQSHQTSPKTASYDVPFRAEYVTVSPAETSAAASNTNAQATPLHEDPHTPITLSQSGGVFRAELVPVDSPSTHHSEEQELSNKAAKSPTAIKATVSVSAPVTEMALTSPAPIPEAKTPASPQRTDTVVPILSPALGGTQPITSYAEQVTTPTPTSQISLPSALPTNKTTIINETAQSTDSALSYEPKVTPVSTSLVSLLAPIPYNPYRTQRADSITSRTSFSAASLGLSLEASPSSAVDLSKILEAKYPPPGEFTQSSFTSTPSVPVSVRPPINNAPEYQPTMLEATEPSPVFSPITSENSFMPQPSSTQREVQLVDQVPESNSFPVDDPARSQPSYNQVDIPESLVLPVQSPSVSQPNDIHADNLLPQSITMSSSLFNGNSQEFEPNNNQTEVLSSTRTLDAQPNNISDGLLPQSSLVSPAVPLAELQPSNVQADILSRESSEFQINANNGDIALLSPRSPPLPNVSLAESHPNTQTNVLIQKSSSSFIPTELQANAIQADVLLPEPLPISPSLPTESYAGPQVNNIQADIPLVQSSHEPPSITTEKSSGPHLNAKADITFIEALSEPPSITLQDSSTQQLTNVQADIPLVEASPISSSITSNISLVEPLHEPPSITTETSSGPQLDAQANNLLIESSSESPSITLKSSSEPQLPSIQDNILLPEPLSESSSLPTGISTDPKSINIQAESVPELPSFTTQDWSGSQLNNVQGDIPFLEPPSVSSSFLPESSSGPQTNDTQAESLPEPPSITTEGWSGQGDPSSFLTEGSSGPQANIIKAESLPEPPSITTEALSGTHLNIVQGDIPFIKPPSVSSSIPSEPQSNNTQAEVSPEPPLITSEGSSGLQPNNVQENIPLLEPLSISSSFLTEGSSGPQANIIKAESLSEPPSITTEALSGTQLNIVQGDIPFIKPPSVSSSIPLQEPPSITTEGWSVPQLNTVQEDIPFIELPSVSSSNPSEHLSGPQTNNTQAEVLPEPPPITSEGSSGHQPNNVQEDIPLLEPLTTLSSIFMESASGPQSNNNQDESLPEPPSCTTTDSLESEPHNAQADIPLLVPPSIPTDCSVKSQISDNQEVEISSKCASHESSGEPQVNNIHADTQLLESSFVLLPTEISPGPQSEQDQPIAPSLEFSPISPVTTSPPKPCPNILVDISLTGSSSASLPIESSSESQPRDTQNNLQSTELSAISSLLPTESSVESQPNDIQTTTQPAELLPISSSLPTDCSSESQPFDAQTDVQSGELLSMSSSLAPEGSTQPNDIQSDIYLAELIPVSSTLPTEQSSDSPPSNIQSNIQSAEPLPVSIPTEGTAELHLNDVHPDNEVGDSSCPPSEISTESQLVRTDISLQESLLTSFNLPTVPESQPSGSRSDGQSLESTAASLSSKSQAMDDQPCNLVQESSDPTSVPIYGSSEPQLKTEEDIPPQEPPSAPPAEAQPYNVQADLLLTESSPIGESSPITNNISSGPLPHEAQEEIPLIETSPVSLPPSPDSQPSNNLPHEAEEEIPLVETSPVSLPPSPDSQPSNNINNGTSGNLNPTSLSEESLPITIQTEEPLTESSVSTFPPNSTSYHGGKPYEALSDEIFPLPIPLLEEVPHDQSLPSTLPFDTSHEFPLRSPSPPCEIVYAEKVLLVEDPHPGSPPVNETFIALESVPTVSPGELEYTGSGSQTAESILVHAVLSSNNISGTSLGTTSAPSSTECDQLLHQQISSNSSQALL